MNDDGPAEWEGTHLEPFSVNGFTVEAWTNGAVVSSAPSGYHKRPVRWVYKISGLGEYSAFNWQAGDSKESVKTRISEAAAHQIEKSHG